jgi:hypothetical protein
MLGEIFAEKKHDENLSIYTAEPYTEVKFGSFHIFKSRMIIKVKKP